MQVAREFIMDEDLFEEAEGQFPDTDLFVQTVRGNFYRIYLTYVRMMVRNGWMGLEDRGVDLDDED